MTHIPTKPSLDELAHYGVKGMKWGVIRDNDARTERKAARVEAKTEKRAQKVREIQALRGKNDVRISELRAEMKELKAQNAPGYRHALVKNQINDHKELDAYYKRDIERVREGRMTQNQRNIAIGVAAVGIIGLAMYANSKSQSGEFHALRLQGEAFLRGKPMEFKKNNAFKGLSDVDSVHQQLVKGINPNYRLPGGQMNCRRCSFAYELRRRGFDVTATTSSLGVGQSESGLINALTPGKKNVIGTKSLSSMVVNPAKGIRGQLDGDNRKNLASLLSIKDASSYENVLAALKTQPSGARGEIVFNFKRFGHSMSYEIFDGKPVIFDTQKGVKYDMSKMDDFMALTGKWGSPANAEMTRLDNMDLDLKFLSRWAADTKD